MTAFVLAFLLYGHPPPLTLTLRPSVCFAPCTVRATVHFERHFDSENHQIPQGIRLVLDSENFYRASDLNVTLHPVTFEVAYYDIPPGDYAYTVQLIERGEVVASEWHELIVS